MKKIFPVKLTANVTTIPGIGAIGVMLFVSLVYSNTFSEGIITAKEVAFVIGTGFTLFLTALLLFIKRPAINIRSNYIDVWVITFLLYQLTVYVIHKKTAISFPVLPLILGCTLLLYILVSYWSRANAGIPVLFYIIIVATTTIHVITGFLQYTGLIKSFHIFFPVTGMFFNPGPYAIYLSVMMVICFTGCLFFMQEKKYKVSVFLIMLLLSGGFLLFILKSRSAWIGLLCGMLFISALFIQKNKPVYYRTHKKKVMWLLLICLPLFCWLAVNLYRMKEASAKGRLLAWQVSADIIKDNLYTGIGPGNFAVAYWQYQHDRFERDKESAATYGSLAGDARFAFNDLLQLTCEGGLISMLLFIALLTMVFSSGIRTYQAPGNHERASNERNNLLLLCALGGIVSLMASGLFSYPLSVLPLNLLFWLLIACVSLCCSKSSLPYIIIRPRKALLFALIILVPAILTTGAGIQRMNAFVEWQRIENKQLSASSSGNICNELSLLSPVLGDYGEFQLTLGLLLLANKQNAKAMEALTIAKKISSDKIVYYCLGKAFEMRGDYQKAEAQYRFVATAMPTLLRPYYLIAKMYYTNKDYEPFYRNAVKVIDFDPKIPSIETEKMKNEIARLMSEMKPNTE